MIEGLKFYRESLQGERVVIKVRYNDASIGNFLYNRSPTANCQVGSFVEFASRLCDFVQNCDKYCPELNREDILIELFSFIKDCYKKIVIIDIRQDEVNNFDEECTNLGEQLIREKYVSTNNSEMVLILFRIDV